MLRRKETLTIITPIPSFIPRQLAIDILHSHSEVITLNPLVLSHKAIPAPRNAAADEYYSTWYEITERIQYIPGMGKVGSGKITFNGCFHDMPWGLQTHIYAPMNIDMRNRYRIQGNQPGIEAPEPTELGLESLGAPKEGLYLREDVEFKCNITMMSFVKAETKKASKEMVGRMIKKAELLDSGVLKGMFENGRLKTLNPADRSNTTDQILMRRQSAQDYAQTPTSPNPLSAYPYQQHQQHQRSPSHPQYSRPSTSGSQYPHNPYEQNLYQQHPILPPAATSPPPVPPKTQMQSYPMELPGDYYYPQQSPGLQPAQPSPGLTPNYRNSTQSQTSSDPRWSQSQASSSFQDTNRTSTTSVGSSQSGFASPGIHPGFASELAAHNETTEEHRH